MDFVWTLLVGTKIIILIQNGFSVYSYRQNSYSEIRLYVYKYRTPALSDNKLIRSEALSSHLRPKEAEFNLFPCCDLATQFPVHEPPQKASGIRVVVRMQNPAAFALQSC